MNSPEQHYDAEQLIAILTSYLIELLGTEVKASLEVMDWTVIMAFYAKEIRVAVHVELGCLAVWQSIRTSIGPGPICGYLRKLIQQQYPELPLSDQKHTGQ